MWNIDKGSEDQHDVRPSLRQISSRTVKAPAGSIAKTKQISGGSSLPSPRTAALNKTAIAHALDGSLRELHATSLPYRR
jgi:hypothetical protein